MVMMMMITPWESFFWAWFFVMWENANSHLLLSKGRERRRVVVCTNVAQWRVSVSPLPLGECNLAVGFAFFSASRGTRKVFDEMSEQRENEKYKYQKKAEIGEGSGCDHLVMSEHSTQEESNGGGPVLEQTLVHEMSVQTQKEQPMNKHEGKGKGVVGTEKDGEVVAPTHDAIAVDEEDQEGDSEGEVAKPPHGIVLSSDNRRRLRWTPELHAHFVNAVKELGGAQKATPKLLVKEMGIEGLTLHQLKSHLQKYRLGKYAIREWERRQDSKKGASSSTVSGVSRSGPSGSSSQTNDHRSRPVAAPKAHKEVKGQLYLKLEAERHLRMRQEAEGRYLDSSIGSAYRVLYDQYFKGTTTDVAGLGGHDFSSIGNLLSAQPSNHNMFYANTAAPYHVDDTVNLQPQGATHYAYPPSLASYGHSTNFAPAYQLADNAQPGCSIASYGFPTNVAPQGFSAFDGSGFQLADAPNLQFGVANQLDSTQPQMANSYELLHPMNLAVDGSGHQLVDTVESQFGIANQSSYITQPQMATQFAAGCSQASYGGSINLASDGFSTIGGLSCNQLDDAGQVQFGMAQQIESIQPEDATHSSPTGLQENFAPEVFPTAVALDGNHMCFDEDPIEAFLMWDNIDMENQANGFGFADANLG